MFKRPLMILTRNHLFQNDAADLRVLSLVVSFILQLGLLVLSLAR